MNDDLVKRAREFCIHTPLSKPMITKLADRIEELEADLRKMALDLIAADGQSQEAYQAQLLAEAKLAKAVEALHWIGTRSIILEAGADSLRLHARMILAELKGEKECLTFQCVTAQRVP